MTPAPPIRKIDAIRKESSILRFDLIFFEVFLKFFFKKKVNCELNVSKPMLQKLMLLLLLNVLILCIVNESATLLKNVCKNTK